MKRSIDASVVIPTRNRWHLLSRALASALAQTGVDHEVIVVDDESTDGTPDRLARLRDARLRVLVNETNRGLAATRNRGIDEARGDWLAFLDDDDVWAPDNLAQKLAAARNARAGLAYASVVVVDGALNVLARVEAPDPGSLRKTVVQGYAIPGGPSNLVARTDLVRAVGRFDERLESLEDWDILIRLLAVTTAARCPEVLVAYVQHGENMHSTGASRDKRSFEWMLAKHAALRESRETHRHFARWIARTQLAAGNRRAAARTYAVAGLKYRDPATAARASLALLGDEKARRLRSLLSGSRNPAAPEWLARYRSDASSVEPAVTG